MLGLILGLMVAGCILQGTFIAVEHKQKYVAAVILKGLASVVFCIIGFIAFDILIRLEAAGKLAHHAYNPALVVKQGELIFAGLVLGALGDILLNLRLVFTKASQKFFLVGIAVFLAGHIVYMISLIKTSSSVLICTICGVVVAAILLVIIFKTFELKIAFKIFGILYIGAVCLMTSYAIGNAVTDFKLNTLMYAIGAVFFLASDVVLIFNTFGKTSKFSLRITNLTLYYIGQLLIATSLFFI